ncbi:MAG: hypothetical protein WBV64_11635, partial [Mycobacterium sp.]
MTAATTTGNPAPASPGRPANTPGAVRDALSRLQEPCHVVSSGDQVFITVGVPDGTRVLAVLPPCVPQSLGSAAFRATHRVKLAYLAGGMARGIASAE